MKIGNEKNINLLKNEIYTNKIEIEKIKNNNMNDNKLIELMMSNNTLNLSAFNKNKSSNR